MLPNLIWASDLCGVSNTHVIFELHPTNTIASHNKRINVHCSTTTTTAVESLRTPQPRT